MKKIIISLFVIFACPIVKAQSGSFFLEVKNEKKLRTDTFNFTYWPLFFGEGLSTLIPYHKIQGISKNNLLRFKTLRTNQPFYFSLSYGERHFSFGQTLLNVLFAIPGDSIQVLFRRDSILFTGKNAAFYQCQLALQKKISTAEKYIHRIPIDSASYLRANQNMLAESIYIYKEASSVLRQYENQMSSSCFQLLQTDMLGYALNALLRRYISATGKQIAGYFPNKRNRDSVGARLREAYDSIFTSFTDDFTERYRAISNHYYQYTIQQKYLEAQNRGIPVFSIIRQAPPGLCKDKWFVSYFLSQYGKDSSFSDQLTKALSLINEPACRRILINMQRNQVKGAAAFSFVLPDTKGKLIRLADLKGKIILLDFWFTGCAACSYNYAEVLGPVERKYRNDPRIAFVSISTDTQKSKWLKSVAENKYTSPHTINLHTGGAWVDHDLLRAYGVTAFPFLVLLDQQGKLISIDQGKLRNKVGLEKAIQSLF